MRKLWRILAALTIPVASLLGAATLSPSAHAASGYELFNEASRGCLQENGTTSAVYVGNCDSNQSSDLWILTPFSSGYELVNVHTLSNPMCVSVTGVDPGVYMNHCAAAGATAQEWYERPSSAFSGDVTLTNAHSGLCLWQTNILSSTVIQQGCSGNSLNDSWDLIGV